MIARARAFAFIWLTVLLFAGSEAVADAVLCLTSYGSQAIFCEAIGDAAIGLIAFFLYRHQ